MASGLGGQQTSQIAPGAPGRWVRLASAAVAALMATTGCAMLGTSVPPTPTPAPSEAAGPAIVVTVGGQISLTATPGVAPTIPDSTLLPHIEFPTRDSAAASASPAATVGRPAASAAARAAQPPPAAAPVAARSSPTPAARR
jgi:hypothetical protein